MSAITGPEGLPDFDDRVLFHVVDLIGDNPLNFSRGITEDDIADRLAGELGLDPDLPHTPGFYMSNARIAILEAAQALKGHGYLEYLAVSGPWTIKSTAAGRRKVAEWRQQWEEVRQRRDREVARRIVHDLEAQRDADPSGYRTSSRLDIERVCNESGIDQATCLTVVQKLIEEGMIAEEEVHEDPLANGYFYITEAGANLALGGSRGTGDEAARAWNEVARLRRELEIARRDVPSLIADDELRRRTEDLLVAGSRYDRVVREACVILEERVRTAIGAAPTAIGTNLMESAFSPKQGRLILSTVEVEQVGLMQMFRGVMAFFRNNVGHHVSDQFTHDEALRFVVLVDMLLDLVTKASIAQPSASNASSSSASFGASGTTPSTNP